MDHDGEAAAAPDLAPGRPRAQRGPLPQVPRPEPGPALPADLHLLGRNRGEEEEQRTAGRDGRHPGDHAIVDAQGEAAGNLKLGVVGSSPDSCKFDLAPLPD